MTHFFDTLLNLIGINDHGGGRWYLWWSGIVGDIGLFGGGYVLLRKHNCHVHGCWRINRTITPEGHAVCHKHNPARVPHLTFEHLVHLHETRDAGIPTQPVDGRYSQKRPLRQD